MRIIFLTHYFPPEVNAPASRTMEHARIWAKAGHEVTVITCAPNHPTGRLYPGYRNRLWQTEVLDGVKVVRLWTLLSPNEGFLLRSLNFMSYLLSATAAAPFLPRADVVVSTSPQFFCGLAGYTVSRIKRRPWVLEIRDLWPESILTAGAMKRGWLVRMLEGLANWSYRTADRVIPLTDSFRQHVVARGAAADRVTVIKNGADLGEFVARPDDGSFRRSLGLEGKFVAAYVGTHGMCHKLETVLEAARLLKDRRDIAFLMVGGGAERSKLAAMRESTGLDNVVMLDQQPKSAMAGILGATDASLVLLKKDDLFKTVLPSKMFEAMAMRRPIILGVEGEACELIEAAGAGLAITPESAEELAAAVTRLADDRELGARLGASGCAHVRERYDRAKLATRYLDVLDNAIASARSSRGRDAARSKTVVRR
ncbi:MAG: glycosyltransferase family 4 protein [Alphaproteobacteria bacterium]|nr:glycosyltransferase family 4 protein [Alphaproteobacteria bacterium]